jgi:hypothetical protein
VNASFEEKSTWITLLGMLGFYFIERDRLVSWRAEHNSSWLLATGVIGAIFGLATPIAPAWIANGLLLALFLAEVLSHLLRLYYYRRGI